MTGRRIATGKLRGVARRLRAIQRWPGEVAANLPSGEQLLPQNRYWNWKLPVDLHLVESRWTTQEIRKICAQSLLDACAAVMQAKQGSNNSMHVTCVLCLPDLFSSELCIYLSEEYSRSHTSTYSGEHARTTLIRRRCLSSEWGLVLPEGFGELGLSLEYDDPASDWNMEGEWFFGDFEQMPIPPDDRL